ncbi:uncharacterized protein I303_106943 [Kwoniella dejecticola CBS 10117]|uniref:AAA+ ATPase domain-containing protein n=1 Tax=Kwoniella dejecticola CBS 10117 TaxID=1296121 RepID=A0AAJ8KUW6_9TREE
MSDTNRRYTEVEEVWMRGSGWQPAPEPTKSTGNEGDCFIAHRRLHPSGNISETATWIEIKSHGLLHVIKEVFPHHSNLYDRTPGIDGRDLFLSMNELKETETHIDDEGTSHALRMLLSYLDETFGFLKSKYEELPAGAITWPSLWWIMSTGSDVESSYDLFEDTVAYKLDSWQYTMDDRGRAFVIKGHHYQWSGSSFQKMTVTKKIPEFRDLLQIDELEFRPLSSERKAKLHAGTGRVMIDVNGFRRANPNFDVWTGDVNRKQDSLNAVTALDSDLWYLLPPSIQGFSLKAKRWGEFLIDSLSNVQWTDHAFSHLVIPNTYRRAIRSLVDVHTGVLGSQLTADVVEGKGEGLILALHGPPGTGKVSEAVSEHLRRPLYIISAGELGTTVTALEKKLSEVLELATSWKAVLLIDEADIFLEKRSATNIERNALVGVFLRLLEYYSGVLFVTTNRLSEFDEAFASRFSLTLAFKDLDRESRQRLWEQNITRCRRDLGQGDIHKAFDISRLSEMQANGRVIKQATRTAQAMALADGEALSMSYLLEVLDLIV